MIRFLFEITLYVLLVFYSAIPLASYWDWFFNDQSTKFMNVFGFLVGFMTMHVLIKSIDVPKSLNLRDKDHTVFILLARFSVVNIIFVFALLVHYSSM